MRPGFLAAALLPLLACSREEKRPERTEPWPALSAVPSGSPRPLTTRAHYEVENASVTFELPAKRATPRGRLLGTTGRFEVDFEQPERSSGSVRVDLELLSLDEDGRERQETHRALEWLELGAQVPEAERETHRFATFSFRALEGADARRLELVRRGKDARPHLDGTAVGELSLHGVRAPVRVLVTLEFGPFGATGEAPTRLVIRSKRPLVVPLGVHDIRPRDARGVLVARELTLLGETVGREAQVSFDLTLVSRP